MTQKAIEQLFRQHYAQMLRQAHSLLYDIEEARDVVSEVFASLLQPTMLSAEKAEAYLMKSVRNRCLDLLEHKAVKTRFEQAYLLETSRDESPAADDERLDNIMRFIDDHLKPQTRRVFKMRHVDGMKYQEIALQLGISRVMVYKYLAEATEQLRQYISKQR